MNGPDCDLCGEHFTCCTCGKALCPVPERVNEGAWISPKDQLPPIGEKVLAIDMEDESSEIEFLIYFGSYKESPSWSSYTCNTFNPTHWMPLPEPPPDWDAHLFQKDKPGEFEGIDESCDA